MEDMFLNPLLPSIIRALAGACHYKQKRQAPGGPAYAGNEDAPDLNYLVVGHKSKAALSADVATLVKDVETSKNNILFELEGLFSTSLELPLRKLVGGVVVEDGRAVLPLMKYEAVDKRFTAYISAEFVDRVIFSAGKFDALMMDAIKGTFHRHSRAEKVILGQTEQRNGVNYPHIFKTMVVKPSEKLLYVRNGDYRHRAFDKGEQPIHAIDSDFEDIELDRHLISNGYGHDMLATIKETYRKPLKMPPGTNPAEWHGKRGSSRNPPPGMPLAEWRGTKRYSTSYNVKYDYRADGTYPLAYIKREEDNRVAIKNVLKRKVGELHAEDKLSLDVRRIKKK